MGPASSGVTTKNLEALDISPGRLGLLLAAWVAILFLVPIAGAVFHFERITGLFVGLLGGLLIGLIWLLSRPRPEV